MPSDVPSTGTSTAIGVPLQVPDSKPATRPEIDQTRRDDEVRHDLLGTVTNKSWRH